MVPESLSALTACRRPLLLQGPMGPFFSRLGDYLAASGLDVRKVHFNGGDEHFYRRHDAIRYTERPVAWESWLRELVARARIDAIVLFGQARPLHRVAIAVARELGLGVFVFEEGYFRPHYVTLEIGGVNGHTSLPRDPSYYWETPYPRLTRSRDTAQRFGRMAWYAVRYAVATAAGRPRYPHNVHHRDLSATEAARWVRGGWRKLVYAWRERHEMARLTDPAQSKHWFLLALQVHNDAQVVEHSPFEDVTHVIHEVMRSFATHAPASAELVVKHHPMDRAHRDYGDTVSELARALRLGDRVRYVHDLHLPTLLKHARGVVTVNSTTGLQAMYHGTPVCVLGECLYALPGLVHVDGLASFWHSPAPVEPVLYRRFRAQVVKLTQLNASFYGKAPALALPPAVPAPAARPATRVIAKAMTAEQPLASMNVPHHASRAPLSIIARGAVEPANAVGGHDAAHEASRA
jgi:capsular polysaccharide export protein